MSDKDIRTRLEVETLRLAEEKSKAAEVNYYLQRRTLAKVNRVADLLFIVVVLGLGGTAIALGVLMLWGK